VAWVESEVYGWINQKIEMNRNILSPQWWWGLYDGKQCSSFGYRK
jgi:hypothetical protein